MPTVTAEVAGGRRRRGTGGGSLRVHVCLDYRFDDVKAGGVVRTWARLLPEVLRHQDLDVTVHAPAGRGRVLALGANARVCEHPTSLRRARWLEQRGVATEAPVTFLPWVRGLGRELASADVIQTTSTTLAYAVTGLVAARRFGIPLVNALQTDAAAYAEVYARVLARRVARAGAMRGVRTDGGALARLVRRGVDRQIAWYLRQCALVLISAPAQTRYLGVGGPAARAAFLPRGIDTREFSPQHRDRAWLARRYGIAPDEPVVAFVGRLAPEKSPLLLACVLRMLAARGTRFTLIMAGNGPERAAVAAELPGRVVLAGFQPHETLRKIYASSDVFAFPSATECFANVVVEAMSSGLPPVVSAVGGARQHVGHPDEDGVVVGTDSVEAWTEALGALLADPARRQAMGRRARTRICQGYPTWEGVVARTLRPAWLSAAAAGVPTAAPVAPGAWATPLGAASRA